MASRDAEAMGTRRTVLLIELSPSYPKAAVPSVRPAVLSRVVTGEWKEDLRVDLFDLTRLSAFRAGMLGYRVLSANDFFFSPVPMPGKTTFMYKRCRRMLGDEMETAPSI